MDSWLGKANVGLFELGSLGLVEFALGKLRLSLLYFRAFSP